MGQKRKEVVISTERVNSYGARVITSGIDIDQYQKNPVLLYMHQRYGRENMPIGYVENLRFDNNRLLGTPVFDQDDPDAKKIESKWEKGVLRMCSPSLEIIDVSSAPELVLSGQTRPTVTKCKLIEISVVDIGGNDDALQLQYGGKVVDDQNVGDSLLPLLELKKDPDGENNNNKNELEMKTILLELGLKENSSSEQAVAAIKELKQSADRAETLALAGITGAVDAAINSNKITADKKDHFVSLGKAMGIEALNSTLELMKPAAKPMDFINNQHQPNGGKMELKWSDLTPGQAEKLKQDEPEKYITLYKSEFGCSPF